MSVNVDFYVLNNQKNPWHEVCHVIEKIYEQVKDIYVHVNSQKEAEQLDELLWTYKDISFLPHKIIDQKNPHAEIMIGFNENIPQKMCLINLARDIPNQYQQFKKVIEFVFSDSIMQQLAREHFKFYRAEGCEINTIK